MNPPNPTPRYIEYFQGGKWRKKLNVGKGPTIDKDPTDKPKAKDKK